jgi:isoquinoline 1-oxidoreductase subunit alpha
MSALHLTINGQSRELEVDEDTPLLWILRDSLGLTGTKFGCGVGVCGACTVLENGKALRSCQIAAAEAAERSFTTIKGLSANADHPCQRLGSRKTSRNADFASPG